MSEKLTCESCLDRVRWRIEVNGEWVGPCCVPAEIWKRYPGWREKEQLSERRAELAKKNLHGANA